MPALDGAQARAFPGCLLDVDYASPTIGQQPLMRPAVAFRRLDFMPAMLDPRGEGRGVATASAVQVREGVLSRAEPKWRRYSRWLEPMRTALQS